MRGVLCTESNNRDGVRRLAQGATVASGGTYATRRSRLSVHLRRRCDGHGSRLAVEQRLERLVELDALDSAVLPDPELLEEALVNLPPDVVRGGEVGRHAAPGDGRPEL